MSIAEEYINHTQCDIDESRRRARNFRVWSCALWGLWLLVVIIGGASWMTGVVATSRSPLLLGNAINKLRDVLIEYPTLSYIFFRISPASSTRPTNVALIIWIACWLVWMIGLHTVGNIFHKKAALLRSNADEAEKLLPFQKALLHTLTNQTGNIEAEIVEIFQPIQNILHHGEGKPWWITLLLSIAAGITVYIITHLSL